MQGLGNLAVVKRRANLEIENSDGDTLYADERMALDEHATARQHQDRSQEELQNSRESLDTAVLDVEEAASKLKDCRNLHDTVCRVPWFGGCG